MKKRIAVALLSALLVCGVFAGCGATTDENSSNVIAEASDYLSIGDTVTIDNFEFTVNSAKFTDILGDKSQPYSFYITADSGTVFLILDVNLKNLESESKILISKIYIKEDESSTYAKLIYDGQYRYDPYDTLGSFNDCIQMAYDPLIPENKNIIFSLPEEVKTSEKPLVLELRNGDKTVSIKIDVNDSTPSNESDGNATKTLSSAETASTAENSSPSKTNAVETASGQSASKTQNTSAVFDPTQFTVSENGQDRPMTRDELIEKLGTPLSEHTGIWKSSDGMGMSDVLCLDYSNFTEGYYFQYDQLMSVGRSSQAIPCSNTDEILPMFGLKKLSRTKIFNSFPATLDNCTGYYAYNCGTDCALNCNIFCDIDQNGTIKHFEITYCEDGDRN